MVSQDRILEINLGVYQNHFDKVVEELKSNNILSRIFNHDYTVWKPIPTEISNRLGWLSIAEKMQSEIPRIDKLVDQLINDGYTNAILLGMGGSSLAPEGFRKIFGVKENHLELSVLDSTDPIAIKSVIENIDLTKNIFIVATKSGGTIETLSFFKHFYNKVLKVVGIEKAGEHFIAITDPNSKLVNLATTYKFKDIFLNDPNIGGRYSVLSFFGLLPAAIIGVDLQKLLKSAEIESNNREENISNIGFTLGAIMGALANPPSNLSRRNKITIITSPQINNFGDWAEQLIAESTGKEGKGILPVVGEEIGKPESYSDDRIFVYLRLAGDETYNQSLQLLQKAGHPFVIITFNNLSELGAQFFIWEIATVIASHILQLNPFDQPNVESAKILAQKMVAEFMMTGKLPEGEFASVSKSTMHSFLNSHIKDGSYISLQAYLPSTTTHQDELDQLRTIIRNQYKKATTVGFGPRFLHSTGQLHKGDDGKGVFIQIISSVENDLPIPDDAGKIASTMGFDVLKNSQAMGDAQALIDAGRSVIRFNFGNNILDGFRILRG